jgi:hypothetical protein
MNDLLTTAVLALVASAHPALHFGSAKQPPPTEKVVVLAQVPTALSYNWQVQPNHAIPCFGAQCDRYYMPTADARPTEDVVLRLLLPDARIIVVECRAKEMPVISNAVELVAGSDAEVPILRACREPQAGSETPVLFEGSNAKLLFPFTKHDGSATTIAETYHIKGTLTPIPGSEESAATMHPALVQPIGAHPGTRKCFVTVIPEDAQVYLDGEKIGVSPLPLNLPVNGMTHQITVLKDGFLKGEMTVRPESDETHFSFILKPAHGSAF